MLKHFRPLLPAIALVVLALPADAQAPNAVAGPNVILSPFNFWSDPQMGRFYDPTAIVIGSNFFLYAHGGVYNFANGGPGSECSTTGEQILIFETPYTHDNIRSAAYGAPLYCASGCIHPAQGPWTYKGLASPCDSINHHYNAPGVFKSSVDGQYKMMIDETDNGTDWAAGDFKRTLLRTSSDGINWTAQQNPIGGATPPFLAQSTVNGQVVSVGFVKLVQGASEWWGTFVFGTSCDCALGRIRVFQNPSNVRGFVAYIWSIDSQWHAVNDDGTFNYYPADTNSSPGMHRVTIVSHLGGYEAWGDPDYFTPTQPLDPKDPGCAYGSPESTHLEANIQEGVADTTTPPPAMGAAVYVTSSLDTNSDHTKNWPLASQDTFGRMYPLRFDDNWGKYILFTSSLDHMCWNGLISSWRGLEILLTVFDK